MLKIKIFCLAGLAWGIFILASCEGDSDADNPNIIIIYADDLGWADVGYNGSDFYETPNIDQLAGEGMIFNRFYPGAANCAPSRACMLTGMYTTRHRVYTPQGLAKKGEVSKMRWKVPTRGEDSTYHTFDVSINQVAPRYASLAELLKRANYISARFGKWHIGDDNQGFDVLSANGTIGEITNINGEEKRYYSDTMVAERLTEAAIDFIIENKDHPFFLYLSQWEVHRPLAARKERIAHYKEKLTDYKDKNYDPVYAAEVEQLDISVGRIMKTVEEEGIEDNTIVIFTSDNGGLSDITSNVPLRGGKGTFYEGGIRTPFCIKWPAVIQPGTKTDYAVNGVDFMPTFSEIASITPPQSQPVDGVSFLPILNGEQINSDRTMFFHFPLYLGGGGKDKVLKVYNGQDNYWRSVPSTTMIKGKWKLIYYYEYDGYELFNLEEDISEEHDLSSSRRDLANKLLDEMNSWIKKVEAPRPDVPNEKFYLYEKHENN